MPPPPALHLCSVSGGCCTLAAPAQCYRAVLALAPAPDLSVPLQMLQDAAAQADSMEVGEKKQHDGSASEQWRWQLVHLDITAGTVL